MTIIDEMLRSVVDKHPMFEIVKNYLIICLAIESSGEEKVKKLLPIKAEVKRGIEMLLETPYRMSDEKQKEVEEVIGNASVLLKDIGSDVVKN